jgi:hypothetical protein
MGRGGDFEGGGLRARGVTSSKEDDGRSGVKAIRIGNRVIDVSEFADRHPGGKVIEYYLNQVDTRTHTHTHTIHAIHLNTTDFCPPSDQDACNCSLSQPQLCVQGDFGQRLISHDVLPSRSHHVFGY